MCLCSVVSDILWPHGLQPTKLLCPWAFPLEWVAISFAGDLPNPKTDIFMCIIYIMYSYTYVNIVIGMTFQHLFHVSSVKSKSQILSTFQIGRFCRIYTYESSLDCWNHYNFKTKVLIFLCEDTLVWKALVQKNVWQFHSCYLVFKNSNEKANGKTSKK